MKTFLLIFFLILIQFSFSQNYEIIDSIVDTYQKKFTSIKSFVDRIRSDFETDSDKTRAVYYWLANNITYDFKSLRKKTKTDYNAKLYRFNKKLAEKTLRKKSAVCEGYAQLLNYSLTELNIIAVVVSGYAKRFTNEIGRKRHNSNHAWNAVKLNKKWHLIDATWSTGNSIYNKKFFNFSDTYFMIDPKKLILSHLPDDVQWQLLEKPISRDNFFNFPIIYEAFHKSGLKLEDDVSGYIETKTDSLINVSFSAINIDKTYYYAFDKTTKSGKLKFVDLNGIFTASIPYDNKRRRNLVISDGQLALMKFKIKLIDE